MMTTAMGWSRSAPCPTARAVVNRPRMVVRAVIRMGRIRRRPVSTMASRFSIPSRRSWLTESTKTMPLLTTTPERTRKPSMATTLRSKPRIHRASRPPVKARGMVNMTMKGESRDWNWAAIMA